MFYPFWDPTYILLIPALLFALYAQSMVQATFSRYMRVRSSSGMTGASLARALLDSWGLSHVRIEMIPRRLGDHYDPRDKVLRLSPEVYQSASIAALGVAAHETGHAIQHASEYIPLNVRNSLVPVANFGSTLAMPLFIMGLLMSAPSLMNIGILAFSAAVLFQVVTLPVEFNASRRALAMLREGGYLEDTEIRQARSVLTAAALTYVAATAVAVMNLIRLLILRGMARDE